FTDMKFGHDPNFKFALARAIYKGVLRFVNYEHGLRNVVTQPLPVHRFAVTLHKEHRTAMLSWLPTTDSLDATAQPTGYVLYTKTGNDDFDNGRHIGSGTQCEVPIVPGIIYSFRITAVNDGGESFPSETLSACLQPDSHHTVLVVNNFTRLSGPARIETADSLGFDLARDMGVPYLYTTAFAGRQLNFNRSALGVEGRNGLGFCGNELMGQRFAGNTFDYPLEHGLSIAATGLYSFCSVSAEAFADTAFTTQGYALIDLIQGEQANVPHNLLPYKTFSPALQRRLRACCAAGQSLLVSGSHVGSDMRTDSERTFLSEVLKCRWDATLPPDSATLVNGLNFQFPIHRVPCAEHYAAQMPDALQPTTPAAFNAFAYANGLGAGVAYKGSDYRVVTMGFPFECIQITADRHKAMQALLTFLLE
ncbi:MAG: fibronectin type III domain-containing protein, partial [Bacteroidales bacterium]|nr:fibronectin type III domain-containing protein [Bacteroidales bacterium]